MQINRALLESSDITRHFMTDRERKVKKALCQLLINKGHRKYAERFWKFDFNIILYLFVKLYKFVMKKRKIE